ncbi:MAG: glutamine-synthetase adenylyltransferase, partial [Rhodospirillales bacterium]|nr:glutamine-synthetase adenylyltransferase [Rhodospirillales bacterium]
VQELYERLFEDEVPESDDTLARVVTAAEADTEAQETLLTLGFVQSPRALEIVHGWGLAPYRAMRYERARDLLADLVPTILTALSKTAEPDRALVRFDEFLRGLPEGVQLFSLLHANAWLLDLLAEIMGSAPRLAVLLGHNAGLLDAVLDTNFYEPLPSTEALYEDLERTLQRARDYQDVLDLTRSWTNEHRFQVGVQILRCTVAPEQAGRSQSDLADVVIRALLPKVEAEFAHLHGRIPEAEIAVLALGKLGGRELTVTSDLDLIFLYEIGGPEISDGEKPLPAGTYFARLSQRFINALTAVTGEGRLYEVDMRLRPSGRGGPIAQTIDGFAKYHGEQAWTWEHMALTRARVVAASPVLTKKIDTLIRSVLSVPRDPVKLVTDVAEMREKLRREFGSDDIWRVKHVRGGLLDVEFIAQYLQLKSAGGNPIVFYQNTCEALKHLQLGGQLNNRNAEVLLSGLHLFTAIQSLVRLCTENGFVEDTAPLGLKEALATAGGAANFTDVKQRLREAESAVYRCFEKLISQPADRYLDSGENEGPESHG